MTADLADGIRDLLVGALPGPPVARAFEASVDEEGDGGEAEGGEGLHEGEGGDEEVVQAEGRARRGRWCGWGLFTWMSKKRKRVSDEMRRYVHGGTHLEGTRVAE